MAQYIKLGQKAESFYDPFSKLSLVGKQVAEFSGKVANSNRVKLGLSGGHLSYASEAEFLAAGGKLLDLLTVESKFGTNAVELTTYYSNNFKPTASELKKFKKLKLLDMVNELTELDEESKTIESKFGKNAEELIKYYEDTYDVKPSDLVAFKKLTLQEMVDELTKLEE